MRWFRGLSVICTATTVLVLVAAPSFASSARSISLSAPSTSTTGATVVVRGTLTNSPIGSLVIIRRRSGLSWIQVAAARTKTSSGSYSHSFRVPATRGTFYYDAYAPRTPTRLSAVSKTRAIVVRTQVRVSLTTSSASPPFGSSVTLTGTVTPWVAGTPTTLQRQVGAATTWISIAALSPAAGGQFSDVVIPASGATNRYRVVVTTRGYYQGATSPTALVTPQPAPPPPPPPPPPAQPLTWSTPTHFDAISGGPRSVSCPSTSFCVAVDQSGAVLTYDGSSWSKPLPVDPWSPYGSFTSVSCPTTTYCVAVDGAGRYSIYDGSTWSTPVATPDGTGYGAISCPSITFCMAADSSGGVTTFNGSTWSDRNPVTSGTAFQREITGLSCASATLCLLGTDGSQAYVFNGTAWSDPTAIGTLPPGIGAESAVVSCASNTFCMALGAATEIYNGTHWSTAASGSGGSLTCLSSTFCMAFGLDTAYEFDGTSWTTLNQLSGYVASSLACASTTFCISVDGTYNRYATFDGTSWSQGASWMDVQRVPYLSVSCVTSTFCMTSNGGLGGGSEGPQRVFDGITWSPLSPSTSQASGIACATATWCLASIGAARIPAAAWDNGNWTDVGLGDWSPSAGQPAPGDFSCFIDTNHLASCISIDSAGNVVQAVENSDGTASGSILTTVPTPTATWTQWATSCTDYYFCVFVNNRGEEVQRTSAGVTTATTIDPGRNLSSVSCPTDTFCVAVDTTGNELTYNGTSWSPPATIDPGAGLTSVSCASTSICVAVDLTGQEVNFDGTSWSLPNSVFDGRALSVSCPTGSNLCAVSGEDQGYQATSTTIHQ